MLSFFNSFVGTIPAEIISKTAKSSKRATPNSIGLRMDDDNSFIVGSEVDIAYCSR